MTNININSLRIPRKGERIKMINPQSQEPISVVMGGVFTSASGKTCSNVTIIQETSDKEKLALACLNERHQWDKNPINIQLIDK